MALFGLSSSYFAFKGLSIYRSVEAVRELGFECCELGAAHKFEHNVWANVKRVKKDFPDLSYTVHGFFPPMEKMFWFNASLGLTNENKLAINNLFKAAEIVEAEIVGIHPGFLGKVKWGSKGGAMNIPEKTAGISKEKGMKKLFEVLRYSEKKASDIETRLVIENIGGAGVPVLVYAIEDFQKIFSHFPGIGMLLDIGHALYEQQLDELLELHRHVMEMHIHFSHPKSGKLPSDEHLPLPEDFNLKRLAGIEQLNRIPLVFEHGPEVSAQEILGEKEMIWKFLRKHSRI